jgi:HD-GYP domain-containing protein (c-di-GMP phosphodiesterase class II)
MSDSCLAAVEALIGLTDQIVFGYPHSTKVAALVVGVAMKLGWTKERIERLKLAAMLHDIGHIKLIADRGSIDRVSADSTELRNHPIIGADYLAQWPALSSISTLVANHQERIDGNGYPNRLRGESLSLDDQLLSLADVFVALTNRNQVRARAAMSCAIAIETIARESGQRWDSHLVTLFFEYIATDAPQDG